VTPTDLKLAVLRKLKVIASGEEATSDDLALMTEKYNGLHAMLLSEELLIWALTEDIPAKCEEPVITMLAAHSADGFGVPEPRSSQLKAEGLLGLPAASPAERLLRKLLAPKHVNSTLKTEYF
jgi:hypothetical protein